MSKTPNIEIRFASEEDVDSVTEFALIALNDSNMLTKFASDIGSDMMKRFHTTGPQNTLLAIDTEKGDAIVGFAEVDPERSKPGKYYFLTGLYVQQDYRNLGLGKKLVRQMLKEKCQKGEELRVASFNNQDQRVWESLDFKIKSTTLYLKNE